jgi:PBP1b-binding outer membrane lipoprotein LpoB
MKFYHVLAILAVAILVGGCGKEQTAAPESAPTGYAGTLVKGQQTAVKTIDVTSLNQDIQLFNVQEGRNPKDLDELVAKHYVGALPELPPGMKFVYDSSQGKVTLASQ